MQIALFQTIQFSMSIQFNCQNSSNSANSAGISLDFIYTQLNVKTVLYQTVQFSVRTVSMSKTIPFQTIQFCISTLFKCKYSVFQKHFYFKLFGLLKQF